MLEGGRVMLLGYCALNLNEYYLAALISTPVVPCGNHGHFKVGLHQSPLRHNDTSPPMWSTHNCIGLLRLPRKSVYKVCRYKSMREGY